MMNLRKDAKPAWLVWQKCRVSEKQAEQKLARSFCIMRAQTLQEGIRGRKCNWTRG